MAKLSMKVQRLYSMEKVNKLGLMAVSTMAFGHMDFKIEKVRRSIKSKGTLTSEVGSMESKVDMGRKHGMMDQLMKENGKTIHSMVKDNSLVLIKEFTKEDGEIINYTDMENLHGQTVKNSQVITNSI